MQADTATAASTIQIRRCVEMPRRATGRFKPFPTMLSSVNPALDRRANDACPCSAGVLRAWTFLAEGILVHCQGAAL
jgi:hypothetical protein